MPLTLMGKRAMSRGSFFLDTVGKSGRKRVRRVKSGENFTPYED